MGQITNKLAFLLIASTVPLVVGYAQNIQGATDIWYDAGRNVVAAAGQSWADYGTAYYYEVSITTGITVGNSIDLGAAQDTEATSAGTYVETPAQPGVEYTALSLHSGTAYYLTYQVADCSWDCYYPYDIFGYSLISGTPPSDGPTFEVWVWAPPIVAVAVAVAQISLGPTQKKVRTPGNPAPVYQILSRAFIPWGWVWGSPTDICFDRWGQQHSLIYKGDNRSYQAYTGDYRTLTIGTVYVGTGTLNYGFDVGNTFNFAWPVLFNPDGSIAISAYDYVLSDCYLENNEGRASMANMHAGSFVTGINQTQVQYWGSAGNPLTLSPDIDWNYTIDLTAVDLSNPLFTIRFTTDCFPAHEVWIGTQQIHGYTPSSSDAVTITYCLSGFGQITGQRTDKIY